MRILLSAYACEPGKGSEPGVGWNVAKELASRHVLTVLTRTNNRPSVENSGEPWIHRVNWVWYDPPKWLTFWKHGRRGVHLFYFLWQIGSAHHVRRSLRPDQFDFVHHITFGNYWIPSFLGSFGPPLVFGPVGGGDDTPPVFRNSYSFFGHVKETTKSIAVRFLTLFFKSRYRKIQLAFAATESTAKKLCDLVDCPVILHPQSALSIEDINEMEAISKTTPKPDATAPRFVTACRLDHWKAVDLAIKAFQSVRCVYPCATMDIIGLGPEMERLRSLVANLRLQSSVHFLGRMPTLSSTWKQIAGSTALVHPALHEAFGQVCLESIALHSPVVCWRYGGPKIIASYCGFDSVPLPDDPNDLSGLETSMIDSVSASAPSLSAELTWPRWCDVLTQQVSRLLNLQSESK